MNTKTNSLTCVVAACVALLVPTLALCDTPRADNSESHGIYDEIRLKQALGRAIVSPDGQFFVFEWLKPYNFEREGLGKLNRTTTSRKQAWLYQVDLTTSRYTSKTPQYLFIPRPRGTYWLGELSPDSSQLSFYQLDYDTNVVRAGVWRRSDDNVTFFEPAADDARVDQAPRWTSNDELVYRSKDGKFIRATASTGKADLCTAGCQAVAKAGESPTIEPKVATRIASNPLDSARTQVDPTLRLLARSENGDVAVYKKDTAWSKVPGSGVVR